MKTIILAMSTTRESPKTIDYALQEAKREGAKLIAIFVVDPESADAIFSKLTDTVFMGERPSQNLREAILKEYQERAQKSLTHICRKSKSFQIDCETLLREGGFTEECLKIIEEKKADWVILNRAPRSNLSRFLFGSAVNELKKRSPCPIKIIEEN